MLPKFQLLEPRTLPEALGILSMGDDGLLPMAGGTNLLPDLRSGRAAGRRYLSLAHLDDLRFIRTERERVEIGGRTTINDLLRSKEIAAEASSLHAAAKAFAGHMVRNAATVAGNIGYGSPSADLTPPLLALDAVVTLASSEGERHVPLSQFALGYRKTACRPQELVTAISWPHPLPGTATRFYKLGLRKGDAITVAGAAVALRVVDGTCAHVRIALGSVAPTVFRATSAEALLIGQPPGHSLIDEAARAAAAECEPIDDLRASGAYRRQMAQVLVRRLLTQALAEIQANSGTADAA